MGRPKGSKNVAVVAIQHPTRCKACQSTGRTAYQNVVTEECRTTLGDGKSITHFTKQLTCCTNCGQWRHDVTYHNVPDGKDVVLPEDSGYLEQSNTPAVKP